MDLAAQLAATYGVPVAHVLESGLRTSLLNVADLGPIPGKSFDEVLSLDRKIVEQLTADFNSLKLRFQAAQIRDRSLALTVEARLNSL
jgi:hypothetical protein